MARLTDQPGALNPAGRPQLTDQAD